MPNPTVETATIVLRPETTEAQLLAVSAAFQSEFLDHQPGFVRRELLKLDERRFLDLIHWETSKAAQAVIGAAANSSVCSRYFSVMEMGADPGAGVTHYTSIETYARK